MQSISHLIKKNLLKKGVTIKNVDLAGTLDIIGEKGSKAYYDGGELTTSIIDAVSNCFCPFYHPSLSGGGGGGALKNPSLARGGGELTRSIVDAIATCFCQFRRGRAVGNPLEGEESSGRLTNFF